MNTPLDPRPEPYNPRPEMEPPLTSELREDRKEGMGAIIAVIAIAALIIVGLLYIMQPPADSPRSITSEAPSRTAPPATPPAATPNQTK